MAVVDTTRPTCNGPPRPPTATATSHCHCERSAAISLTAPNGALPSRPGGRPSRHRDCRVAIAPRNDSCCLCEPLSPRHCERSAAISLPAPNGALPSRPGGRTSRHRDCRVAIAPRNDSCCLCEPLSPRHCKRSAAISLPAPNGALPSRPGGRSSRHRDCRVAISPRNDSCCLCEPFSPRHCERSAAISLTAPNGHCAQRRTAAGGAAWLPRLVTTRREARVSMGPSGMVRRLA